MVLNTSIFWADIEKIALRTADIDNSDLLKESISIDIISRHPSKIGKSDKSAKQKQRKTPLTMRLTRRLMLHITRLK